MGSGSFLLVESSLQLVTSGLKLRLDLSPTSSLSCPKLAERIIGSDHGVRSLLGGDVQVYDEGVEVVNGQRVEPAHLAHHQVRVPGHAVKRLRRSAAAPAEIA